MDNNVDIGAIQALFNKFYNTMLLIIVIAIVAITLISIINLLTLSISSIMEKYRLYVNDYKIPNYKTYPFKLLEYLDNSSSWSKEPAFFFNQQSMVTIVIQVMLFLLFFVMLNVVLYLIITLTNVKSKQPMNLTQNLSNNKNMLYMFVFCIVAILVAFFAYKQLFGSMVYEPLVTLKQNIDDIDKKVDMLLIDSKSDIEAAFNSNSPDRVLAEYWNKVRATDNAESGATDPLQRKILNTLNIINHFKSSNREYMKDKRDYWDFFSNPQKSKFSFVGFSSSMHPFIHKLDTPNVERMFDQKDLSQLNDAVRKDLEDIQRDVIALRNDLIQPVQYLKYSLLNALVLLSVVLSGGYALGFVKKEYIRIFQQAS